MPGLLVSVRSAPEAASALLGGAHIIDIKEPAHGALGRADDAVIADIVRFVGGRRPVSAAFGELADRPGDGGQSPGSIPSDGESGRLSFVKYGLAGCGKGIDWRGALGRMLRTDHPQVVIAAYADWECARAPHVDEVCAFACARPGNILLIDTHCKEPGVLTRNCRPTLLDWLPVDSLSDLCRRCRQAGVRIALAGSLGVREIEALLPARPDWFGVRGAVCEEGQRGREVRRERVRELADLLNATTPQCR